MQLPFAYWKFTPLSVPGMQHWVEADYGVTLSANTVGSALDRSGNGRTVTGPGGASNPDWIFPAYANRPTMNFISARLTKLTFAAFNPGNTFYFLVVLQGTNAASNVLCYGDGAVNHQLCDSSANAGIKCFDNANLVISNALDISTKVGNIAVKLTAGTMSCKYNGTAVGMTTAAGLTATMTIADFGQVAGGAAFSDAAVSGWMLFTTLPANSYLETMLLEYWRTKYHLY